MLSSVKDRPIKDEEAIQCMSGQIVKQPLLHHQRRVHTSTSPVTFTSLLSLLQSILPPADGDVPFVYYQPYANYNLLSATVPRVIFSITPTKGVYKSFDLPRRNGPDVYFLHRPWELERHRRAAIRRRARVVLSSHKVFDELLTVGWNAALAERLDLDVGRSVCIRGYKTDTERRIGLLAPFTHCAPITTGVSQALDAEQDSTVPMAGFRESSTVLEHIRAQFGSIEKTVGFDEDHTTAALATKTPLEPIRAVAIMNAFRREEVERIARIAAEEGLISDATSCSQLPCLTGEVRSAGVEAALEYNMKVVCVGHKTCEDWGIRYLMHRVQAEFPGLEVHHIDEPEEPRVRRDGVTAEYVTKKRGASTKAGAVQTAETATRPVDASESAKTTTRPAEASGGVESSRSGELTV